MQNEKINQLQKDLQRAEEQNKEITDQVQYLLDDVRVLLNGHEKVRLKNCLYLFDRFTLQGAPKLIKKEDSYWDLEEQQPYF